MTHTIPIDGQTRQIDIRTMDESFIVYRKMYVPPLTRENIGRINPGDYVKHIEEFQRNGWQKQIEEFLRKLIRGMGSCAILAWEGEGVVAKMYFITREMQEAFAAADACFCVENDSMPRVIGGWSDEQIGRLLASESRTLRICCFNIGHFDTRYHGHGLASRMIDELKEWARPRGWRRIEIESAEDVVAFRARGPNTLRRSYLEKRGFRVIEETPVPENEIGWRTEAVELFVSGKPLDPKAWDVRSYPRNIETVRAAAKAGDWQRLIRRDLVMACEL